MDDDQLYSIRSIRLGAGRDDGGAAGSVPWRSLRELEQPGPSASSP
jgi:hypothetical protein